MTRRLRAVAELAAIPWLIFGPFFVVQMLLFLEFKSPWHSQVAELIFIFVGVAVGAVGVWMFPIARRSSAIATVAYFLLMIPVTWVSALNAVCGYFGDCM